MVFVIGTYLTIGRILTPLFTILGFLLVYFYSHPKFHREVLWGLGQAIVALGSFYVIAGFLTIKALLISFGTGSLAYVGIKAYRLITGDYDNTPPSKRGLTTGFAYYALGTTLLAVGLSLPC